MRKMGADHVVDHRGDLVAQVADLGLVPSYVAALTATDQHYDAIVNLIAPRGQIALIDDPEALDIKAAKPKALSIHWEFMTERGGALTAEALRAAHLRQESGRVIGKQVLGGF